MTTGSDQLSGEPGRAWFAEHCKPAPALWRGGGGHHPSAPLPVQISLEGASDHASLCTPPGHPAPSTGGWQRTVADR